MHIKTINFFKIINIKRLNLSFSFGLFIFSFLEFLHFFTFEHAGVIKNSFPFGGEHGLY